MGHDFLKHKVRKYIGKNPIKGIYRIPGASYTVKTLHNSRFAAPVFAVNGVYKYKVPGGKYHSVLRSIKGKKNAKKNLGKNYGKISLVR